MLSVLFIEISIVFFLTVLNGILAMSELAVVSARPARSSFAGRAGSRGAETALRLASDPGRFLSTVQIGITLVGVLSGAFSGATLGARLSTWLSAQGPSETASDCTRRRVCRHAHHLSVADRRRTGAETGGTAQCRGGCRPDGAVHVDPVQAQGRALLVWLLDGSGKLILSLLGQSGDAGGRVTDEEIRTVLAEAHSAGLRLANPRC